MIEINELLNDDIVKKYIYDGIALPVVDAEDNGKILGVENGEWKAVNNSIPNVNQNDDGKILKVENGVWVAGNHAKYVFNLNDDDRELLHPVNFTFDKLIQTINKGYNPVIYGSSGRVYQLSYIDPLGAYLNFNYFNIMLSGGVWSFRAEKLTFRNDQSVTTSDIKSVTIS